MLLLDLTSDVQAIALNLSYMGPFLGLVLCGLGLPLPEETFLLLAGYQLNEGEVEFLPITLLCSFAILLGDSLPFFLGRRYGMRALEIRWVAKALHPERFQRFRRRFDAHGNWAVFGCRFLPMFRIPGYFVAGTMGMRYTRFLWLDSLGVLLSVPLSIYLGKLLGKLAKEVVHELNLILAIGAFLLILVIFVRRRWAKASARPITEEVRRPPDS